MDYLPNTISIPYIDETFTSNRGSHMHSSLNSAYQLPKNDYLTDGTCGIDKVRITIPLLDQSVDLRLWAIELFGNSNLKGDVEFDDFPNLYISSYVTPSKAVQVEFNASDFTYPLGYNLCPFELLPEVTKIVIAKIVDQSSGLIMPSFFPDTGEILRPEQYHANWAQSIDISRIEISRDFTIKDPKFNLEQLKYAKPQRSRGITHIINDKTLNTLTHPAASTSRRVVLYNKTNQMKDKDPSRYPDTTIRFEVKLPRKQVKTNGISKLAWACPQSLEFILKDYWTKSNYHEPLLHGSYSIAELIDEYGVYDGALLIGYATACEAGLKIMYSTEDQKRFNALLKHLHIKPHLPLSAQGTPYGQLDLKKGTIAY